MTAQPRYRSIAMATMGLIVASVIFWSFLGRESLEQAQSSDSKRAVTAAPRINTPAAAIGPKQTREPVATAEAVQRGDTRAAASIVEMSAARALVLAKDIRELFAMTESWPESPRSCARNAAVQACSLSARVNGANAAKFDAQSRTHAHSFNSIWCADSRQLAEQHVRVDGNHAAAVEQATDNMSFSDALDGISKLDPMSMLDLDLMMLEASANASPEDFRNALRNALALSEPECNGGQALLSIADTQKKLAAFDEFRKPMQSSEKFRQSVALAIEMRACRTSKACGPMSPLTINACYESGECRAYESLIDVRRRTTAPDVYQWAEHLIGQLDRFADARSRM